MRRKGKRFKDNISNIKLITKIIAIAMILLIIIIAYIFNEIIKTKDARKQEIVKNEEVINKLLESRNYENILIENIEIFEEYGNIYFVADVKNNSENKIETKLINIIFFDEEGNSIIKFKYHLEEIGIGEITPIKIITTEDLTKAYDFRIEY